MIDSELFHSIATYALPTLFAITAHEAAHGYAAKLMGDNTAYRQGRVTLNPGPHIDPIGTIVVPALCLLFGGLLFGWAKPVPINPSNMRYPRKSPFWVALAGPASNFAMALGWALLAWVGYQGWAGELGSDPLVAMGFAGIQINLMLMILNLLPLPPLDGARMVERFLRGGARDFWAKIEPYGFFILLGLALTGLLSMLWMQPWFSAFSWMQKIPYF